MASGTIFGTFRSLKDNDVVDSSTCILESYVGGMSRVFEDNVLLQTKLKNSNLYTFW